VTFANIPQSGYTDLKVVCSARGTQADVSNALTIRFNGATSGYSTRELVGSGSAASSTSRTNLGSAMYLGNIDGNNATANTYSNTEIYIPNYNSTTINKSISVDNVSENNGTEAYATLIAGLYSSTSAITSIDIVSLAAHGVLMSGSTFSLYGLAALGTEPVIAPKASGGNVIETDGTYWYHAFLTTGAFVPQTGLSCDVLVVAGGGGADNGGGGAGGVLGFASQSLASATSYTATIGAGGAGGGGRSNGVNSQFAALTASVGGGFGGSTTGNSGGSGGGSWASSGTTAGGTGTTGQGNNGGSSGSGGGGGGGGSGAVGANATTSTQGGSGGAGVNTVTNWGALSSALTTLGLGVSGFIAGGGGGYGSSTNSTGGSGGGGTGAAGGGSLAASAGVVNTGSGGGNGALGTGGSGIVIIRYLVA
jgi:hypothetical protein